MNGMNAWLAHDTTRLYEVPFIYIVCDSIVYSRTISVSEL